MASLAPPPFDLFEWGSMKSQVYENPRNSTDHTKQYADFKSRETVQENKSEEDILMMLFSNTEILIVSVIVSL